MSKWYEIFQADRPSSKGFTEKDLEDIVSNYNPQSEHEAAMKVAHGFENITRTRNPELAGGWVSNLKKQGKSLYAQFKDVDEKLKNLVQTGRLKKVSAEIYPNYINKEGKRIGAYLRAVAFLGTSAPAIKGMQPVTFSEKDEHGEFLTFSLEEEKNEGEKMNEELVKQILAEKDEKISMLEKANLEKEQEFKAFEESIEELKNEIETVKAENDAKTKEYEKFKAEQRNKEVEVFCEKNVKDPKKIEKTKKWLRGMSDEDFKSFQENFSDLEPPVEQGSHFSFSENGGASVSSDDHTKNIRKFAQEKGISLEQALEQYGA